MIGRVYRSLLSILQLVYGTFGEKIPLDWNGLHGGCSEMGEMKQTALHGTRPYINISWRPQDRIFRWLWICFATFAMVAFIRKKRREPKLAGIERKFRKSSVQDDTQAMAIFS